VTDPIVAQSCTAPVVIDTNILLDIFVFQDPATAPLRQALFSGGVDAVRANFTLSEFADVLSRDKFRLTVAQRNEILTKWQAHSRALADDEIDASPWKCKDRDDQIFLDLAYTLRPCVLLSKDLQVLKFRKRAAKESVVIADQFPVLIRHPS
jgi:putative PIN family toxin of toxin-antitoxin system